MHAHKQRLTGSALSDSWHERNVPCVTAKSVYMCSDMAIYLTILFTNLGRVIVNIVNGIV